MSEQLTLLLNEAEMVTTSNAIHNNDNTYLLWYGLDAGAAAKRYRTKYGHAPTVVRHNPTDEVETTMRTVADEAVLENHLMVGIA